MAQAYERLWPEEPLVRTPEQLAEIACNYTEWDEPPSGYPEMIPGEATGRLFLEPEQIEEITSHAEIELDGGQIRIRILDLPGGHDALYSAERAATLSDPRVCLLRPSRNF